MLYKRLGMQNCCNSQEKLFASAHVETTLFTIVLHGLFERTGDYSEDFREFPDKFFSALRCESYAPVSLAKYAYFGGNCIICEPFWPGGGRVSKREC
jgi:hypothetical protein